MEKELERQRLLEIERAKTKELRHNLDMEKERQTQVHSKNRNSYCEMCYKLIIMILISDTYLNY